MSTVREPHFTNDEVAALAGLLGGVADTTDLPARRQRLLQGLSQLIRADTWLWTLSRFGGDRPGMSYGFQYGQLSEQELLSLAESTQDARDSAPGTALVMECIAEGRACTIALHESLGKTSRESNPNWQRYLSGFADAILSVHPSEKGLWSCTGLHRRSGGEPFQERERRIAHMVLTSVPWLHLEAPRTEPLLHAVEQLPPRPRVVLILLLDGCAAKEIAQQMDLSPHTVRQYIKQIYQALGVTTRGELHRHFAATRDTPAQP